MRLFKRFSEKILGRLPFLLCLLCCASISRATHLIGGYLRAEQLSSSGLTVSLKVIGFSDAGSAVLFGSGTLDFGDGSKTNLAEITITPESVDLGNGIIQTTIEIEHTFPAAGTYVVSYTESNRNAGILNANQSVSAPFFTETQIKIDPLLGKNTTPQHISAPNIFAMAGQRFFNSIAFSDEEGDSLVYRLAIPQQGMEEDIFGFRWPNDPMFYESDGTASDPQFQLDRLSGQLIWDAPPLEGEFVFACRIIEYRKVEGQWYQLSQTIADMQLNLVFASDEGRTVDFDYTIEAEGSIGFTLTFEDEEGEEFSWLFHSNSEFEWGNESSAPGTVRGHAAGKVVFSGVIKGNALSDAPVIVLAEAGGIQQGVNFKTSKSYAIHPSGREYVLTAIGDENKILPLRVFPNPADDRLTLLFDEYVSAVEIQLLGLSGQTIYKGGLSVYGKLATLTLEAVPTGVYLLRIENGDSVYLSRFVKN